MTVCGAKGGNSREDASDRREVLPSADRASAWISTACPCEVMYAMVQDLDQASFLLGITKGKSRKRPCGQVQDLLATTTHKGFIKATHQIWAHGCALKHRLRFHEEITHVIHVPYVINVRSVVHDHRHDGIDCAGIVLLRPHCTQHEGEKRARQSRWNIIGLQLIMVTVVCKCASSLDGIFRNYSIFDRY